MKNAVVTTTSLGHALCHVSMLVLPTVLAPIGLEYGLSLTQVTAVGTVAYLLFGFGAIPAGFVTRFTSSKLMLIVYFGGIAAASVMVGLAPSFGWFVAGMALLGTAASIYHVAGPTLISHRTQKPGRAFGIHGVSGSAGITLAPLVAGVLAGSIGWRYAYLFLVVPAVAGVVLLLADKTIPYARVEKEPAKETSQEPGRLSVFILLMAVLTVNGFVYRGALTMFPTHLSSRVSLAGLPDVVTGGVLASGVLAFGMVGMYAVGNLADRTDRFRLYAILIALVIPLLIAVGVTTGIGLIVSAIAFSLVYFPYQPVENSILGTYVPPHLVSSVFGMKFTLTLGIGSFGAVAAGAIAERSGTTVLFVILAAANALSLVLALAALALRKRGQEQRSTP